MTEPDRVILRLFAGTDTGMIVVAHTLRTKLDPLDTFEFDMGGTPNRGGRIETAALFRSQAGYVPLDLTPGRWHLISDVALRRYVAGQRGRIVASMTNAIQWEPDAPPTEEARR